MVLCYYHSTSSTAWHVNIYWMNEQISYTHTHKHKQHDPIYVNTSIRWISKCLFMDLNAEKKMPGRGTPNATNPLRRYHLVSPHVPRLKENMFPNTICFSKVLRFQRMRIRWSASAPVKSESLPWRKEAGWGQPCLFLSFSLCLFAPRRGWAAGSQTPSMEDGPRPHSPQRSFWEMDPRLPTGRSLPPGLSRGRSLANELLKKKKSNTIRSTRVAGF